MRYQIDGHQLCCWYNGPPDQLVASGAVESHMLQTGTRGKVRTDSNGYPFTRRNLGQDRVQVFRRIDNSIEHAAALPGMSLELLQSPAEDPEESSPSAESTQWPGIEDSNVAARLLERRFPGIAVEVFRRWLDGNHIIVLSGQTSDLLNHRLIRECHIPPGRKRGVYIEPLAPGDPDCINRVPGGALKLRIEIKGDLPAGHALEDFSPSHWPFFESSVDRQAHYLKQARARLEWQALRRTLELNMDAATGAAERGGLFVHPDDVSRWSELCVTIGDQLNEFVRTVRIESASRPKLRLVVNNLGTEAAARA